MHSFTMRIKNEYLKGLTLSFFMPNLVSSYVVIYHCKSERSVLAVQIGPFRWVRFSPIWGGVLCGPLNQGPYSPITLGWFRPKGRNESHCKLWLNSSRRSWIRLCPAALNWVNNSSSIGKIKKSVISVCTKAERGLQMHFRHWSSG